MLQQVSEATIAAEHCDQVHPAWAWVLQVVDRIAGDADKVPTTGGDAGLTDVEHHVPPQNKEQLGGLVMAVGGDPIAGVMHL